MEVKTKNKQGKKRRGLKGTEKPTKDGNKGETYKPDMFVLSKEELKENEYPLIEDHPDYVDTSTWDKSEKGAHMLAMDCEMCKTCDGLELTRISIVDEENRLVYDSFVKPANPILDYLTRWSGITEEILQNVEVTIAQVQEKIREFVFRDTILVGHSLENDLHALKIVHDNVIDTAISYGKRENARVVKKKLKYLAQHLLNEEIQVDTHNSIVDAQTAMSLVRLKIKHGFEFGIDNNVMPLPNILSNVKCNCALVDEPCSLQAFRTASAFPASDLNEVLEGTLTAIKNPNISFTFARFMDLVSLYKDKVNGVTNPYSATEAATAGISNVESSEDVRLDMLRKLDDCVGKIYDKLRDNGCLMLFSGTGNVEYAHRLVRVKHAGPLSEEEMTFLASAIARERAGIFGVAIKQKIEATKEEKDKMEVEE